MHCTTVARKKTKEELFHRSGYKTGIRQKVTAPASKYCEAHLVAETTCRTGKL